MTETISAPQQAMDEITGVLKKHGIPPLDAIGLLEVTKLSYFALLTEPDEPEEPSRILR